MILSVLCLDQHDRGMFSMLNIQHFDYAHINDGSIGFSTGRSSEQHSITSYSAFWKCNSFWRCSQLWRSHPDSTYWRSHSRRSHGFLHIRRLTHYTRVQRGRYMDGFPNTHRRLSASGIINISDYYINYNIKCCTIHATLNYCIVGRIP
jgi:hypothetical protein